MASIDIFRKSVEDYIGKNPGCAQADVARALGVKELVFDETQDEAISNNCGYSIRTLQRMLDTAVASGLILRDGAGRSTVYNPSEALRKKLLQKHLATDLSKRPRVGYIEEWLDDYEPNKSSLLLPADLARLHARCAPGAGSLAKFTDHDISMFLCDIAYASSHMEGNSYSRLDTVDLIEHHYERVGGSHRDKVMILNHRDAARYIIDSIRDKDEHFGVNEYVIRSLHSILSQNLMSDPRMCGQLRSSHVEIHESSYVPLDIAEKIGENFSKMLTKASAIKDPFEASFFVLAHLSYLQPFNDCNKRTSRIACNIPLMKAGVTPMSWLETSLRQDAYRDALISVYEHNDTLMLKDVYIDNFMRSIERFSIFQRNKDPGAIAANYRAEIKQYIRGVVLEACDDIPETVPQAQHAGFVHYVTDEIEMMKSNDMMGVRYGLSKNAVAHWIKESETAQEDEALSHSYARQTG